MKTKERKAESEPDEEKGSEEVEDSDSVWLMLYNSIFSVFRCLQYLRPAAEVSGRDARQDAERA